MVGMKIQNCHGSLFSSALCPNHATFTLAIMYFMDLVLPGYVLWYIIWDIVFYTGRSFVRGLLTWTPCNDIYILHLFAVSFAETHVFSDSGDFGFGGLVQVRRASCTPTSTYLESTPRWSLFLGGGTPSPFPCIEISIGHVQKSLYCHVDTPK